MPAETSIGKKLEKFLQRQVNKILSIEQKLRLGEYEGTLTKPEVEKLNLSISLSTKTVDGIKKAVDGYKLQLDGIDIAVKSAEGLSLAGPAAPQMGQLLIREKAKEQFEDLAKVINEQGENAFVASRASLSNSRKLMNRLKKRKL